MCKSARLTQGPPQWACSRQPYQGAAAQIHLINGTQTKRKGQLVFHIILFFGGSFFYFFLDNHLAEIDHN